VSILQGAKRPAPVVLGRAFAIWSFKEPLSKPPLLGDLSVTPR
jgi:hypothetical protein